MLLLPHAAFGTVLATKIENPSVGLTAAFFSHYLLDAITHWAFTPYPRLKEIIFTFLDLFLGLGFGLIISLKYQSVFPFLGAGLAMLPDAIRFPYWWLKIRWPILLWHEKIHMAIDHETLNILLGLLPQIVIVGLSIWILI